MGWLVGDVKYLLRTYRYVTGIIGITKDLQVLHIIIKIA